MLRRRISRAAAARINGANRATTRTRMENISMAWRESAEKLMALNGMAAKSCGGSGGSGGILP